MDTSLDHKWEELTLMEIIAERIGVDFYEEWSGNDGCRYRITEHGVSKYSQTMDSWHYDPHSLRDVVLYGLRPKWSPQAGDTYYTIDTQKPKDMIKKDIWSGADETEELLLRDGLVFENRSDAIATLVEILELLKSREDV